MWYVVAFVAGALVVGIYTYYRVRKTASPLDTYTPEQAEKERERIVAHADSFRDRITEETAKGHDEIDDF